MDTTDPDFIAASRRLQIHLFNRDGDRAACMFGKIISDFHMPLSEEAIRKLTDVAQKSARQLA